MRQKLINTEKIQGYLYDFKLEKKKVQNKESKNFGQEYIGGSIDVLTSEDGMNIVTVKYTYVVPKTSKGSTNKTYDTLLQIIENGKTVIKDGKDNALKVKVDTSLALNEFLSSRTDENGERELVSAKENNGGFVTIVSEIEPNEDKRTKFECDMFITGYRTIEANEERGTQAHGEVSGWVFNFKGDPLPVTFKIRNEAGMNYFEGLDLNEHNPIFTLVRGILSSSTRVVKNEIKNAWTNDVEVEEKTYSSKEWLITSSSPETYPLDDAQNGIVPEDVQNLKAAREKTIAEIKARQEAYEASKSQGNAFGGATDTAPKAKVQQYSF